MTERRKRMIECLPLRGLSARTQEMYVRAVRQLAEHSRTSPDMLTEADRRPYFLSLKHVKQSSRSASTIARCGITFFFQHTRNRHWTTLTFVRPPREQTLPVILRREEVHRLLGGVRLPRDRVCLTTIDSCGLRRQEGTPRQGPDRARARLLIHLRHGHGGNDRSVPVPHRPLARRRHDWVTHRHPVLIVPAPGRGRIHRATATTPMPKSRVQGAFRDALQPSGIHQQASGHTLRHCWATPRLEAGVNLRLMQVSLGHRSPTPTRVSTHLTARAAHLGADAINRLMGDR